MYRDIDEYILVEDTCSTDLLKQIDNLICKGYQPYGSLLMSGGELIQPMVKYKLAEFNPFIVNSIPSCWPIKEKPIETKTIYQAGDISV